MKDIKDYFDDYGLISHKIDFSPLWDSGDSAQRTGMFLVAKGVTAVGAVFCLHYSMMLKHDPNNLDIYVRHPRPNDWPSDPSNFSMDQFKPLIVAMGIAQDHTRLWNLWVRFDKRFGFSQNIHDNFGGTKWKIPDWIGLSGFGNFIRAFRNKWLYPLLFIFDLGILVNVLIRIYKGNRNYDDVGDDLNLCVDLVQAFYFMPTPLSMMSRRIYFKHRKSYDPNVTGPQYALDWYFRSHLAPPLNDLWKPVLEKIR